ncbi:PGAP1-like alpha/beta domain-containing protein [Nocardioides sp. MAHUQ-72]|uniref:PGAP1-like alpha/beta domain-containing protein n=1 Tax=unclassified Nocardioides TaxID=2615069 RepID=UPI003607E6D3
MSTPDVTVSGGAGGIDARYDDIERLGRLYGDTGAWLLEAAWDDKLEAADGDLLASAILSPGTFAAAEGAIVDATYGPRGLVARALVIEAESFCFVAVVEVYRSADELRHGVIEALSYGLGFVVGVDLPGVLVLGGIVYGGLHLSGVSNEEMIAFLEDHPEIAQTLVNGGGGLLDGMSVNPLTAPLMDLLGLDGFHPDTGSAADDLGDLLFGDHAGDLNDDYPSTEFQDAIDAPHDVQDVVDDLGVVATGTPHGVINVQQVVGPDGSVRYIVQLPGTDEFLDEHAIRNMGSNLDLIAGDSTAYADAIRQAMEAAHVPHDAPVMLVGHSQGGMQAAALAGDPDFEYHVTHVVTAGSPVATSGIPDHVQVLSLENTGDVVPLLDGEANPATAHHTTVQADLHSGSFGAGPGQNHSLSTYSQIAGAVDASDDPSVQHFVESLQQQGFLDGTTSSSTSFQTQQGDQVRPAGLPIGSLVP